MPKVSVLVPSFNHAPFLRTALESALRQTLRDLEVLVLDDGSTDGSLEVASSIRDPRLRVESNPSNLGTYGTQQRGLEKTDSEFVAILNSDDFWEPGKLELQVRALEERPECPYCYTLGWVADAEGRLDTSQDVHADWPKEPVQDLLPWLLYENRVLASSVLFRRRGLRFHTECRYSGDWVVQLEVGAGRRVVCVAERLSHWR
ncbi:MAG: glycosyltransferase family 2 protein, partial [Fimbriimonadales bacterium]|nr:glycosyltransferase family 2 protein [Fimbriimonadales bacterium]